ncbi:unnamed protein product [Camellia sinensis]
MKYPNSFCARILQGIYFPHSSFLEAVKGRRASWAWASILQGRNVLMEGLRWQIHSGANVQFWKDKWVPTLTKFKLFTPVPDGSVISKVEDVIDSTCQRWKVDVLRTLVSESEMEAIRTIPLPLASTEDALIWHFDSTGVYSVKSGYHVTLSETQNQ